MMKKTGQKIPSALHAVLAAVLPWRLYRLLPVLLALLLAACGGGSGSDSGLAVTASTELSTLAGVALNGGGIAGIVTLKDVPSGQMQATHTDNGRYDFNVTGLSGPFLLRMEPDDQSAALYGVALKTGATTRGNINPLTQRVLALLVSYGFSGVNSEHLVSNAFATPPPPLAELDAEQLAAAIDRVLARTSPYFRQRLQAHGAAVTGLDIVAGNYGVGQGLDRAFAEVKFFYDDIHNEGWEKSAATGEVLGGYQLWENVLAPWYLTMQADASYLVSGASAQVTVTAGSLWVWNMPLHRGIRWELSDPSLADIDEQGRVTAKSFTGTYQLTVTAYYQSGDSLLSQSLALTLTDTPVVQSVDMSGLPDTFAFGEHALQTTVKLTPAAGGATTAAGGGNWQLVDPDPYVSEAVSIRDNGSGQSYLLVGKIRQDATVKLRATQNLGGYPYTTEKVVTIRKYVAIPASFSMSCPSTISYGASIQCTGTVRNQDGQYETVAPVLSVPAGDANAVTVNGDTMTSIWESRTASPYVTVTGSYGEFKATQLVSVSARKTRLTGIEITGLAEISENASTRLQAWGTWDDGSRSDISYGSIWTSSDTSRAVFGSSWSSGGMLQSRYILDQQADQAITVSVSACPVQGEACGGVGMLSASFPLTVRYTSLALTGLELKAGENAGDFLMQGRTYNLSARALWNKKLPDGSTYATDVASGLEWSSNHSGVVVNGNQAVIGAVGDEPLAMLTARYRDPHDAGVVRTGRYVYTLYAQTAKPRTLSFMQAPYNSSGRTYLLGGDGLARPLESVNGAQPARVVGAPDPFVSNVVQVVYVADERVYLTGDGAVWYPERVRNLSFSPEMRDQLMRQLGGDDSVPRRIGVVSNVTMLAPTGSTIYSGGLAALTQTGNVLVISLVPTSGGNAYSYSATRSGVRKIMGGYRLLMLMQDGSLYQRENSFPYHETQIVQSGGQPLSNVVDMGAMMSSYMAQTSDGKVWTWGSNSRGELGLGDRTDRSYASQVPGISDVRQIAGAIPAVLRNDGALWTWGIVSPSNVNGLPQQLQDLPAMAGIHAAYVTDADGKVWWWGREVYDTDLSTPLPLLWQAGGSQVSLP